MGVNLAHTVEQGSAVAGLCWREACSSNKQLPFSGDLTSTEIAVGGVQQRKAGVHTKSDSLLSSKGQLQPTASECPRPESLLYCDGFTLFCHPCSQHWDGQMWLQCLNLEALSFARPGRDGKQRGGKHAGVYGRKGCGTKCLDGGVTEALAWV